MYKYKQEMYLIGKQFFLSMNNFRNSVGNRYCEMTKELLGKRVQLVIVAPDNFKIETKYVVYCHLGMVLRQGNVPDKNAVAQRNLHGGAEARFALLLVICTIHVHVHTCIR